MYTNMYSCVTPNEKQWQHGQLTWQHVTYLATGAYLQQSCHSPYSVSSPTDFPGGNPTAPPLLILQALQPGVKGKHTTQVPDAAMQVSSWTSWQVADPLLGDLTESSWPADTGGHLGLAHPYTQLVGSTGKVEVSRKKELYHQVDVIRSHQHVSEKRYIVC